MVERTLNGTHCQDCTYRANIFRNLTAEELEILNQSRFQVRYKAGEIIFKQGTPSPYFVCITSGMAKLYIEGYGKNLILGIVKAVDYIFGPGIYVDNRHYYSASAIADSTACLVDVALFKQMIRRNPDFAEEFITRVSHQAIINFSQLICLTQKHMHGRIADTIYYLYEKIYQTNPFEMSVSRQDLADLSGMSKESAIRILKEFKDEGIISVEGNTMEILNLKQLLAIRETG